MFYSALRGVAGQKPEVCLKEITVQLAGSKDYAQARARGAACLMACSVWLLCPQETSGSALAAAYFPITAAPSHPPLLARPS